MKELLERSNELLLHYIEMAARQDKANKSIVVSRGPMSGQTNGTIAEMTYQLQQEIQTALDDWDRANEPDEGVPEPVEDIIGQSVEDLKNAIEADEAIEEATEENDKGKGLP